MLKIKNLCLGLGVICFTQALQAFSVTPMMAQIDLAKSRSVNLKVHNDSDKEVKLETKVYEKQQQKDGSYNPHPSSDLIAFPPLLKIAPNTNRTLRIILPPKNSQKAVNRYYKIVARELPDGKSTKGVIEKNNSVDVKIELNTAFHIPVYVYPKNPKFSLDLLTAKIRNNRILTSIKNDGTTIVRLKDQQALININGLWEPANLEPQNELNALVKDNIINQTWDCSACAGQVVRGVRITGNSEKYGEFKLTKTWNDNQAAY